jgi:hypothetical protein
MMVGLPLSLLNPHPAPHGLLVLLESLQAESFDHVATGQVTEIFDVCFRLVIDCRQLGRKYPHASTARQVSCLD